MMELGCPMMELGFINWLSMDLFDVFLTRTLVDMKFSSHHAGWCGTFSVFSFLGHFVWSISGEESNIEAFVG